MNFFLPHHEVFGPTAVPPDLLFWLPSVDMLIGIAIGAIISGLFFLAVDR
jgi:hypothetical protein